MNRKAPSPDDLLLIGRVLRAHGVRGEVKVLPLTDDPGRFDGLDDVFIGPAPERVKPVSVEAVRFQPTKKGITVVLKFSGVDTREAAETLRKAQVFAREADLPALEEDEVYLHDLIGLAVVTEAGEPVGVLADVLDMPGQFIYVVSREGKPEAMIPAVPEFVVETDLEGGRLVIRPIEGLLA